MARVKEAGPVQAQEPILDVAVRYTAASSSGQARCLLGILAALLLLVVGCSKDRESAPAPAAPARNSRPADPPPIRKPFETIKPH